MLIGMKKCFKLFMCWVLTVFLVFPAFANETQTAYIDVSSASDGYVSALYSGAEKAKLVVQRDGGKAYTYNLAGSCAERFTLTDGNGRYNIRIYENTNGQKYRCVASVCCDLSLANQDAPFVLENQYVKFSDEHLSLFTDALLARCATTADRIKAVHDYVVSNIKYDCEKANSLSGGYIPSAAETLLSNTGICFDYASLVCAMLRYEEIPAKLCVGYAGNSYHAWVKVFDGDEWKLYDPTFEANANGDSRILAFIGNGSNYSEVYCY